MGLLLASADWSVMKSISFPFRFFGGVVAATKTYDEVVRGQVIDALMTNQGERVFRPRYGCDAQSALFDPRDELVRRDAAGIIRNRLEQFVPRCVVTDVGIETPGADSLVYITIKYRSALLATEQELTVPLEPASAFFARSQLGSGEQEF